MDKIASRQILNREIREIILQYSEDKIEFPRIFYFCEKMGEPTFKITIDKLEDTVFIDSKGRKWMMANHD